MWLSEWARTFVPFLGAAESVTGISAKLGGPVSLVQFVHELPTRYGSSLSELALFVLLNDPCFLPASFKRK